MGEVENGAVHGIDVETNESERHICSVTGCQISLTLQLARAYNIGYSLRKSQRGGDGERPTVLETRESNAGVS